MKIIEILTKNCNNYKIYRCKYQKMTKKPTPMKIIHLEEPKVWAVVETESLNAVHFVPLMADLNNHLF